MNTDFSTNRREPKGFEDLGVVREQNTNEFDDTTTTYNIRTLSRIQTPEQRLFKYVILSSHRPEDSLSSLNDALDVAGQLDNEFKVMACVFTCLNFVNCGGIVDIDKETSVKIMHLISLLFQKKRTSTYEMAIVCGGNFLELCSNEWLDAIGDEWKEEILNQFYYVVDLYRSKMLLTEMGERSTENYL
ncbi:unnamed protein product [Ambrosiozyma monospora]|uniref:Unnamed protein product n=1 Tax=Ambrosiozyma monospora TaxID=43982 RepID=A0ACB5UBQ1_AMBMO|nr:unnamed protein product [Ambrosiozyma monospora]